MRVDLTGAVVAVLLRKSDRKLKMKYHVGFIFYSVYKYSNDCNKCLKGATGAPPAKDRFCACAEMMISRG